MPHKIRVASTFLLLFCGMAKGNDLVSAVEQDAENEWNANPVDMIDAIALHGDAHETEALRKLGLNQTNGVKLHYMTAWDRSKDDFWNAIVRGQRTARSCRTAYIAIETEFNDASGAGLEALQRASDAYQKQHNFSALAELLRRAPAPDGIVAYRECYFAAPSPGALFRQVETVLGPRK